MQQITYQLPVHFVKVILTTGRYITSIIIIVHALELYIYHTIINCSFSFFLKIGHTYSLSFKILTLVMLADSIFTLFQQYIM